MLYRFNDFKSPVKYTYNRINNVPAGAFHAHNVIALVDIGFTGATARRSLIRDSLKGNIMGIFGLHGRLLLFRKLASLNQHIQQRILVFVKLMRRFYESFLLA